MWRGLSRVAPVKCGVPDGRSRYHGRAVGGTGAAWIFAGGLLVALGWVAARREALARVLFATVDPRPMAIFRIGFGACLLALVWETAPLSEYLFSDEGLLPRAAVAEARGVQGLGPGGPEGLLGGLRYLVDGRWSLLHLFTGWTFIILPLALLAARRHSVARHRRMMMGLFYGGFAINLLIAFIPGRTLWTAVFG